MMRKQKQQAVQRLLAYYPPEEAEQLAKLLLEKAYGKPYAQLLLALDKDSTNIPPEQAWEKVEGWLMRLLAHEPVQYVLGEAYFGEHTLTVTPAVLIPRPETEYLLHLIAQRTPSNSVQHAIDVATGSGAIAIALASLFPLATVEAVDVSTEALAVAQKNAVAVGLQERIRFARVDLLAGNEELEGKGYNLLVSNPPYILPHEKAGMRPHVLEQEPHIALFVPAEDPLLYYRRIFSIYAHRMAEGGEIYFEGNPLTIEALLELGLSYGWHGTVLEDMCGRKRYTHFKQEP